MPNEITHWLASTPVNREHDRAIERVHAATSIAATQAQGVAHVTQTAMLETFKLGLMKREFGQILLEDAAKFDLLVNTAVFGMAGVINRLGQP